MRWTLRVTATLGVIAPVLAAAQPYGADAWGTLGGRVLDATTLAPLPFCNVTIDSLARGTATSDDGTFVFRFLPEGEYTLVVSYIGYVTRREHGIRVESARRTERSCRVWTHGPRTRGKVSSRRR